MSDHPSGCGATVFVSKVHGCVQGALLTGEESSDGNWVSPLEKSTDTDDFESLAIDGRTLGVG